MLKHPVSPKGVLWRVLSFLGLPFPEIENIFTEWVFLILWFQKVSSWNIFLGSPLILKYKEFFRDFRFPKYKKSFRLRKCKTFLNIRATMFHSPKYKKIWELFSRVEFSFIFRAWKVFLKTSVFRNMRKAFFEKI